MLALHQFHPAREIIDAYWNMDVCVSVCAQVSDQGQPSARLSTFQICVGPPYCMCVSLLIYLLICSS